MFFMFPWLHYVKSFCNLSLSWSRALLLALNTQQHVPGIIFQLSQDIKAPANSEENSERHGIRLSLEHWELFHIHSGGYTLLFSPHYSLSWGSSMLSSARFIDMVHKVWTLLPGRHVSSCSPFLGSLAKTLGRLSQPFWFRDPHCLLCLQGIESFSEFLVGLCWGLLRTDCQILLQNSQILGRAQQFASLVSLDHLPLLGWRATLVGWLAGKVRLWDWSSGLSHSPS